MTETIHLFVGERPSPTARRMKVGWADGRLAAKQLFDALRGADINPLAQHYENVFLPRLDVEQINFRALARVRRAGKSGVVVVAMGLKAARVLADAGIPHRLITHPAARGRIRKKDVYIAHVREILLAPLTQTV
jgi:hypothetical protein